MSPEEQTIIRELSHCTFRPASYEKRFVRNMVAAPPDATLTDKQRTYLYKLRWSYRNQIARYYRDISQPCPLITNQLPMEQKSADHE